MSKFIDLARYFRWPLIWFFACWLFNSLELAIVIGVSVCTATLLNRIGQTIVGMLSGLSLVDFWFGPVDLDFSTSRTRVFLLSRLPRQFRVGFDADKLTPERAVVAWRRVAFAGPLTSFALAVWSYWLPGIDLTSFFVANVVLVFLAFIPFDDRHVWMIHCMRNASPKAINLVEGFRLLDCMKQSGRPREWPADFVALADELLRKPERNLYFQTRVTTTLFLYEYLADRGELDKAIAWLEWLESTVHQADRSGVFDWMDLIAALRARHYALWNNDPGHAKTILKRIKRTSWVRTHPDWKMANSLIKLSRGSRRGAKRDLKSARSLITPWLGRSGSMEMKSEWLDIIEQRINEASSPTFSRSAPSVA